MMVFDFMSIPTHGTAQIFGSGAGSRLPSSVLSAFTTRSNCSSNFVLSDSHPVKSAASFKLAEVVVETSTWQPEAPRETGGRVRL